MNYDRYSQLFFAANNIPIAYFKNNKLVNCYGYPVFYSPDSNYFEDINSCENNISINIYKDNSYYGFVKKDNHCLIMGPVYVESPSDELLRLFMHEHSISLKNKDSTRDFLSSIRHCTYHVFFNIASLTYFTIYRNVPSLEAMYSLENKTASDSITQKVSEKYYEAREDQSLHGTYQLEQQILEYIRSGNVAQLEIFLKKIRQSSHILEGRVGDSPLRQAKNIFLGQVALIGKTAAIPAGLDIELTYHLIDQYSLECENLQSITAIENLQYNMIIDFAKRISENLVPGGLNQEIYSCIQYVNGHVNEYISVNDVADHINRSRSYTLKHFKEELGFNLGEYIVHAKIQEAKSLLSFTDKSLIEISNYLCFSSQSYFQNVFKKVTGQTPLAYRKKTQDK